MFKMKLLLLASILTSVYGCSPRVRIKQGELIGTTYTLPNNRKVYAFLGIPYAAPPIGDDRFEDPKPVEPWEGSRKATSEGNICIQILYIPGKRGNKPIGDEDCLFLNVFTPKLPAINQSDDELMNVLFYIHGGGFIIGSGNLAYPDYILQDDNIVFVSINYRLGALGFFSFDDPLSPGNYGLKDQVEALRWVHCNIRYFGGNPDKVTIYGNSAGAASVHYHMLSPLSKGLFQNAISSSGSVSTPWSLPRNVVRNSKQLASTFNCTHKNVKTIMECLKTKSAKEIVEESSPFKGNYLKGIPYGPVVEPQHHRAFLSEDPYNLLKKGKLNPIPFMTGVVENEGSVFGLEVIINNAYMDMLNKEWNEIAPKIFSYSNALSKPVEDYVSSSIRKYYFGNESLSNETSKQLLEALGDRYFYHRIIDTGKLHASVSSENTFCYKFYYRGTESLSDFYPNTNDENYGVCHSDDTFYVLKSHNGNKKTKNDKDMTKLLCSSIIAFMKNGNPSTRKIKWEPMSKNDKMNCLVIYSYTYQRMEDIENHDSTDFWTDLLPHENRKYDPR